MEIKVRKFIQIALIFAVLIILGTVYLMQPAHADSGAMPGLNSPGRNASQSVDEPPRLDVSQRFRISFPHTPTKSGHILNRTVHNDFSLWPEMNYLNEDVILDGSKITISDFKIVAGGTIPKAYLPETGKMFDAPDGGLEWHRWGSPAVIIPPKASLVIVNINLEPALEWQDGCINPSTEQKTELRDDDLTMAYSRLGEISPLRTFIPGRVNYGPYNQPQSGCFGNGWYYFFLGTLDPDPSRIWLAYNDYSDPEIQAFWTLTSRP